MGFFDKIKSILSKEIEGAGFAVDMENVRTDKLPVAPEWFFSARMGQPRDLNVGEVRSFARSAWVQMVLNTMKKEVSIINWEVVKEDDEEEQDFSVDIDKATAFFMRMNQEGDDVNDLYSEMITDIGEIDAGVLAKVYSTNSYEMKQVPLLNDMGDVVGSEIKPVLKPLGQRELVQVRSADGSTFLKQVDVYRRLRAYYQYSFKNPRANPVRFEPDEIIYYQMNRRSYSIYGFSPVQSIQQVLEVLIQSTRWNKDYFKNNAIPAGIIGLPNANKESMTAFQKDWDAKVKGKPHRLLFHNTAATFSNFMSNSKDMEWLEGQKWYFHLVFAVFGVSPVEAGFHENVNQGNQAGQERVTVKNAIKPFLKLNEKHMTKLISEILQKEDHGLVFRYKARDHAEEQIEHEQDMVEIDKGALTINEFRRKNGMDPVEWGDTPGQGLDAQFGQEVPIGNNDDGGFNDSQGQEQDGNDKGKKEKPGRDPKSDAKGGKEATIPYTKAFEMFVQAKEKMIGR
jgi:HK97 family phage portal protein